MILGCAAPSPDEVNIGRVLALRLGCGDKVPGWTVMRNCASGMQALDSAIANIQCGRSQLVLAGGTDALSRAPLLFSDAMVRWLVGLVRDARPSARSSRPCAGFRLGYLAPVIGIVKGLTDPVVGLLMGQTAENLAWRFGISRRADGRVLGARATGARWPPATAGRFGEIVPLVDSDGTVYAEDDGVRNDSTPDKLGKLRPVFDKPYGNITAGNSSQITDGAACCCWLPKKRWRAGT